MGDDPDESQEKVLLIVESGLKETNALTLNDVDDPMLLSQAPRPSALENVTERFRLSDS